MVGATLAELLVGVVPDLTYGYVLTLGVRGVLAELIADTASLLIPASPQAVRAALRKLRICPVLEGYRGMPAVDIGAMVETVMAVQRYVIAHHDRIEEVEINLLMCGMLDAVAAETAISQGDISDKGARQDPSRRAYSGGPAGSAQGGRD